MITTQQCDVIKLEQLQDSHALANHIDIIIVSYVSSFFCQSSEFVKQFHSYSNDSILITAKQFFA